MMIEYYNENQFEGLYPIMKKAGTVQTPDWLILAGPADGNEAQCDRRKWPEINILGLEPNHEARRWQLETGRWPMLSGGLPWCSLLKAALSDGVRTEKVWVPTGYLRSASMDPTRYNEELASTLHDVDTTTLDSLDDTFGPFQNAILWMDIEGYEYKAIIGGMNLLKRRGIMVINIEMLPRPDTENAAIDRILRECGYKHVGNVTEVDFVYTRDRG